MYNWPTYYLGFACHAATHSKDSTKVGAALVGPKGEVRMTGYNGPPRGVLDTPERLERPAKYLFACHAEISVLMQCARVGIPTDDCDMYITHMSCSGCAKAMIQAGIKRVYVGSGKTSMPIEEFQSAKIMLEEVGIEIHESENLD